MLDLTGLFYTFGMKQIFGQGLVPIAVAPQTKLHVVQCLCVSVMCVCAFLFCNILLPFNGEMQTCDRVTTQPVVHLSRYSPVELSIRRPNYWRRSKMESGLGMEYIGGIRACRGLIRADCAIRQVNNVGELLSRSVHGEPRTLHYTSSFLLQRLTDRHADRRQHARPTQSAQSVITVAV